MIATYSVREVADALGISHDTVTRLVRRGEVAHLRIGRKVRFTEPQIVALTEHLTVAPLVDDDELTTRRSRARRRTA